MSAVSWLLLTLLVLLMCSSSLVLDVAVGKYLDTSLIKADVQPRLARFIIKGRLLQLVLPLEVSGKAGVLHSMHGHSGAQRLHRHALPASTQHSFVCEPKAVCEAAMHMHMLMLLYPWRYAPLPLHWRRCGRTVVLRSALQPVGTWC
jgi:hypothetical protein